MTPITQPPRKSSAGRRPGRMLTVTARREYKRLGNHQRYQSYDHPELRIGAAWLRAAGLEPGDKVQITAPKPGFLVVSKAPPQ